MHNQERLSQQLEVAEQGKMEAEKLIEKQQLRIEELQAELHLAEAKAKAEAEAAVRVKRVERETLVKSGEELTVEGAGADKSKPASPIIETSVGGITDKIPVEDKPMEASPGDKAAVMTNN